MHERMYERAIEALESIACSLRESQPKLEGPKIWERGAPVVLEVQQVVDVDVAHQRLRVATLALVAEFEAAVREAEFREGVRQGMHVPFHGVFAEAAGNPRLIGRMQWWAKRLRTELAPREDELPPKGET